MNTARHAGEKLIRHKAAIAVIGSAVLAIAIIGAWYSMQSPSTGGGDVAMTRDSSQPLGIGVLASPRNVPAIRFEDEHRRATYIAGFPRQVRAPQRMGNVVRAVAKEMPALDRLRAQLGGTAFQVVALSLEREGVPVVKKFYEEIAIKALPVYVDATIESMGKLGIVGVPTTLLIDREGREVVRYTGRRTSLG